jgi:hypothetical protein
MMKSFEIKKRDREAELSEANGTVAVGLLTIISGGVVYAYSTTNEFLLELGSMTKVIAAHYAVIQYPTWSPAGFFVGTLLVGSGLFITGKGLYDHVKAVSHMRSEEYGKEDRHVEKRSL